MGSSSLLILNPLKILVWSLFSFLVVWIIIRYLVRILRYIHYWCALVKELLLFFSLDDSLFGRFYSNSFRILLRCHKRNNSFLVNLGQINTMSSKRLLLPIHRLNTKFLKILRIQLTRLVHYASITLSIFQISSLSLRAKKSFWRRILGMIHPVINLLFLETLLRLDMRLVIFLKTFWHLTILYRKSCLIVCARR